METTPIETPPPPVFTQWETRGESFIFLHTTYDVDKAKRSLKRTPIGVQQVDPRLFEGYVTVPANRGETPTSFSLISIVIDWNKVWSTYDEPPSEVPILIAPFGTGHICIDGWHRVARALFDKRESIPAVVLGIELTRRIASNLPKGTLAHHRAREAKASRGG